MARYVPNFDELDKQLGKLLREWGRLEFIMAALFAAMVGRQLERHMSLFYAIVSNQARAELMRKALLFSDFSDEQAEESRKVIAQFQSLNSTRNKYVHGLYSENKDGILSADFTKPSKEKDGVIHGTSTFLNGAEIPNHLRAVDRLAAQIRSFMRMHKMLPAGWE